MTSPAAWADRIILAIPPNEHVTPAQRQALEVSLSALIEDGNARCVEYVIGKGATCPKHPLSTEGATR